MIAVDTNIVVRLLTGDDAAMTRRARHVFDAGEIFIPKTVLLETEWVLRRLYEFPGDRIVDALRTLMALPNVRIEDAGAVADALRWSEGGVDFADALHCAASRDAGEFATFDRKLVNRARKIVPLKFVSA